jgi:hypothetical protein
MKTTIWNSLDLIKAALVGSIVGLIAGLITGYQWAWQPVVNTFRPLIG